MARTALDMKSFQELAHFAERQLLEAQLGSPASGLLSALSEGKARRITEQLVRAGVIQTMHDALTNAQLRAEVRWQGGVVQERALMTGLARWVDAQAAVAKATPAPPPPPAKVRPSGLHDQMNIEELTRWAEARGVADLLRMTADLLGGRLSAEVYHQFSVQGWGSTLGGVLTRPPPAPGRRGQLPALPAQVRAELQELLERAADERVAALAEEAGPRPAPAAPEWQPLWTRLVALRAQLRKGADPLPVSARAGWEFAISQDPPAITVATTTLRRCATRAEAHVTVALTEDELPRPIGCDCGMGLSTCQRRLAAVDLALDLLSQPQRAEQGAALVEASLTPLWRRALLRIDPLLATDDLVDKDGPVELIGWRLKTSRGELHLEPVSCRPKKRGEGYKLTRISLDALRGRPDRLSPGEAQAVEALTPLPAHGYGWSPPSRPAVLRALCHLTGHPRVFLESGGTPQRVTREVVALRWATRGDGGLELSPRVGERAIRLNDLLSSYGASHEGDLLLLREIAPETLIVAELPARALSLLRLLGERGAVFPPEARGELMSRLPAITRMLPCDLDAKLRGAPVAPDPRLHVQLEVQRGGALMVDLRARPLADGPLLIPGEGEPELYTTRKEGPVCCARDLAGERAATSGLLEAVPLPEDAKSGPLSWLIEQPERSLAVLEALEAQGASVAVSWRGDLRRRVRSAFTKNLSVKVKLKHDWLGLSGGLEVDGVALDLLDLLKAVRSGATYVPVDGQTWLKLSEPFREALAPVAAAARDHRGGGELSGLLAPLVEALGEQGASLQGEAGWTAWLDRLKSASTLDPALPDGLRAELRDYQHEGYVWLSRLAAWSPGACLADDMGLGKTVQALALLLRRASLGPTLVVTPTSVSFNWLREAERFAPSLRVRLFRGPSRLEMLDDLRAGDVLVTSYDLLVRDVDRLSPLRFATLVLDEAQAFKNANTRRARAVCALQADFRLALTGTPIENRSAELWSLFHALAPALLGSWEHFRDRYAGPIERGEDSGRRKALARLIRPFILRRHKSEVARELPPRTEIRLDIDLSREERAVYEQIRRDAVARLSGSPDLPAQQRRVQILAELTRLRQAACHPWLVEPELSIPSSKLAQLRELVAQLREEGNRALVFSQFVRLLTLAREALHEDGVRTCWLDGSTPERQRRDEVDAFQRGEADVFLLSLKAGGTGLNLTAATYVIHLDPWWNPAVEDQATDRAHRIGQDQPVTVYRLVARATLEEAILGMHADKRQLAAEILEGTGNAAALSVDELMNLLTAEDLPAQDEGSAEEEAAPPEPAPRNAQQAEQPVQPDTSPTASAGVHELLTCTEELSAMIEEEVQGGLLNARLASGQLRILGALRDWLPQSGRTTFPFESSLPWWGAFEATLNAGRALGPMRAAATAIRERVHAFAEAEGWV